MVPERVLKPINIAFESKTEEFKMGKCFRFTSESRPRTSIRPPGQRQWWQIENAGVANERRYTWRKSRVNLNAKIIPHKPPFRAEHIGSLLRPPELMAERARFVRGEIDQAALAAEEDAAIRQAIRLQEQIGFKFVTDGEFRRRSYHSFFYRQLGKLSIDTVDGADAKGGQNGSGRGEQPVAVVGSRVQWTHPINTDDVAFLKSNTDRVPKITIPGPCALHFRSGDAGVLAGAYKDLDQFWSDITEAFAKELHALAVAGCRYFQIDETAFAKFGDPNVQASLAARGDDWSRLIDKYIDVTNRVLRRAPADLHIGIHLCRGNRGGHWHAGAATKKSPIACSTRLMSTSIF